MANPQKEYPDLGIQWRVDLFQCCNKIERICARCPSFTWLWNPKKLKFPKEKQKYCSNRYYAWVVSPLCLNAQINFNNYEKEWLFTIRIHFRERTNNGSWRLVSSRPNLYIVVSKWCSFTCSSLGINYCFPIGIKLLQASTWRGLRRRWIRRFWTWIRPYLLFQKVLGGINVYMPRRQELV